MRKFFVQFTTVFATLIAAEASVFAAADHQQCFKVKDDAAKATYTVNLEPSDPDFPVAEGCTVKVPAKLFCIGVDKTNESPTPPGAPDGAVVQKSLCYKVKCPKRDAPITPTVRDQFGTHGLSVGTTSLVCAPTDPNFCLTTDDCAVLPNATNVCTGNTCTFGACNSGYADCNADPSDGCEVAIRSDTSNCGACSRACSFANSNESCVNGNCRISSCWVNYENCDFVTTNGCEVNLSNSTSNCGACGNVCSFANAGSLCTAGTCSIGGCASNYGNCDADPANGCEADLKNDESNCGSCGRACTLPARTCTNGNCTF